MYVYVGATQVPLPSCRGHKFWTVPDSEGAFKLKTIYTVLINM
uniref:Uncharacterized protein n=1 Tax=Meloidogyne enterolobii TaxID=390850 RepID=A0A6V7WLN2_MELEN|nr:unnamed protein product [Meloidogyne enterolobii]